jgi:hypothetical protein
MANKQRSRLEEQILEILEKAEHEPRWRRWLRQITGLRLRFYRYRLTHPIRAPRWWRTTNLAAWTGYIGAFVFVFLALIVAKWIHWLAQVFALLSLLALYIPILLNFRRPVYPSSQRWRGRDISLSRRSPLWRIRTYWDRLRRQR